MSVIKRLTGSLRDTAGFSADYQTLVRQFESVGQAVENARTLVGSHELIGDSVGECLQLSRQFQESTQRYRASISTAEGSGNRIKYALDEGEMGL